MMAATPVTPIHPLTREDLQLLRKATGLAFDRTVNEDGSVTSQIRVWLKGQQDDVYWGAIAVPSSHTTYSDGPVHHQGFASIHSPRFARRWQTVLRLLRAGDELRLSWVQDNNTDNIRQAGLHFDSLDAVILRGGRERYEVRLEDSVCPDNSARMLRLATHLTRLERHLQGLALQENASRLLAQEQS
jgi:hypothetical protein